MVYKTSKTSKSKKKSKKKTIKNYKGGDGGQDLSKAEDQEEFNNALAKQFKGKLKGNFGIQMYKFAARLGYTLRYNVKFMKKIQSSYTFSKGGYFINNILSVCKNDMNKRNNYYALCILLRLFYPKDIAQTYSYIRLQQNITDNCITIYNIEKQKQLIDSYKFIKNNEHILDILKDNKFYGLLQKIMNNTDPINKLKNMEQGSGSGYQVYSNELSSEFNQCLAGSATINPIIDPVVNQPVVNQSVVNQPNLNLKQRYKKRSEIYNKLITKPFIHKTSKMLGLKQRGQDFIAFKKYTPKILHNVANAVTMGTSTQALEKSSQLKDWTKKQLGIQPTQTTVVSPQTTVASPQPAPNESVSQSKLKYYQKIIEEMFKVVINKRDCDLSYIILFVLNNILNKIPKLKYIHNDIPYIHNDAFCDQFYKILETEDFKKNTFCQDEYIIDELLA